MMIIERCGIVQSTLDWKSVDMFSLLSFVVVWPWMSYFLSLVFPLLISNQLIGLSPTKTLLAPRFYDEQIISIILEPWGVLFVKKMY